MGDYRAEVESIRIRALMLQNLLDLRFSLLELTCVKRLYYRLQSMIL